MAERIKSLTSKEAILRELNGLPPEEDENSPERPVVSLAPEEVGKCASALIKAMRKNRGIPDAAGFYECMSQTRSVPPEAMELLRRLGLLKDGEPPPIPAQCVIVMSNMPEELIDQARKAVERVLNSEENREKYGFSSSPVQCEKKQSQMF